MFIQRIKRSGSIMSTKRRTYKSYSPELKLEAVKRALLGESVKVIAHHLDITDPDYIYKWIDQYEMYGEVGLNRKRRNHPQLDKDAIIRVS
jgi:transposase